MLLYWLLSWLQGERWPRVSTARVAMVLALLVTAVFAVRGEGVVTVVVWVLILVIGTTMIGWVIDRRPRRGDRLA